MARRNNRELFWNNYPYGVWTCRDGRQVVFNIGYIPLWQKHPGRPATRADPNEYVEFVESRYIYRDLSEPWSSVDSRIKCEDLLAEWGVLYIDTTPYVNGNKRKGYYRGR